VNLNKLSDKIVFNSLKFIKHGNLKITNHDGKEYIFGNSNERLNADLKINKPGLTFKIIKNGSVGLAEAYMDNYFETNNLTDLIELAAKKYKNCS
jgi:cyclopropane-fatty-acyl-phospholipid synthase